MNTQSNHPDAEAGPRSRWYRLQTDDSTVGWAMTALDANEAHALARQYRKRGQSFECVRMIYLPAGGARFVPCAVPWPSRSKKKVQPIPTKAAS